MITWDPQWGNEGDLGSHRGFVYDPRSISNTLDLTLGHVVSFTYQTKTENVSRPRLAFVMHPNWEGKCHALTLKFIDRDLLVEEIYPQIRTTQNPEEFYYNIYKPSATLYTSDAYRTFFVNKMKSITQFNYAIPDPESDAQKMEEYFKMTDNEADRAVMFEYYKKGYGIKEVREYYDTVVLKRIVPGEVE
jgi:hypothetical protein